MTYDRKPNTGALFPIAPEKQVENGPQFNGNVKMGCPHCRTESEFWLSGWKNKSKKTGQHYMTLKAKPKDEPRRKQDDPWAPDDPGPSGEDDYGSARQIGDALADDIPF